MKATFTWGRDFQETRGWLLDNCPNNYFAGNGRIVAHDLLEHGSNQDGTWRDEFLALGAMIWVRGETYFWEQRSYNFKCEYHLSGDVTNFIQNYPWVKLPRTKINLTSELRDLLEWFDFDLLYREVKKNLETEQEKSRLAEQFPAIRNLLLAKIGIQVS